MEKPEEGNNPEPTVEPENQDDEKNKLIEELATLKQDKANLVSELTEERSKKQERESRIAEIEAELESLKPQDADPEKIVKRVLAEKEKEQSKQNFDKAQEVFKSKHKEFADDEAGIISSALDREMKKFSFDGLSTVDEYVSRLEDVYRFMTRKAESGDDVQNPYANTPKGSFTPKVADNPKLDPRELKLIQNHGWTEERFLKIKEKRPHYVETLLQWVK